VTALALCSWLGGADRFSSSRKAVRFTGLDITVHSSDTKRSPGRLSRQGPEVLRWLPFEAAKTSARSCAPGYRYYTDVKDRYDANRATLRPAMGADRSTSRAVTGSRYPAAGRKARSHRPQLDSFGRSDVCAQLTADVRNSG
jgi:hypothetical protein